MLGRTNAIPVDMLFYPTNFYLQDNSFAWTQSKIDQLWEFIKANSPINKVGFIRVNNGYAYGGIYAHIDDLYSYILLHTYTDDFDTQEVKFKVIDGVPKVVSNDWELIGVKIGNGSISVDANKYRTILVTQYLPNYGSASCVIYAGQYGYYYTSSDKNTTSLVIWSTEGYVTNSLMNVNGADRLAETAMAVYGRR